MVPNTGEQLNNVLIASSVLPGTQSKLLLYGDFFQFCGFKYHQYAANAIFFLSNSYKAPELMYAISIQPL